MAPWACAFCGERAVESEVFRILMILSVEACVCLAMRVCLVPCLFCFVCLALPVPVCLVLCFVCFVCLALPVPVCLHIFLCWCCCCCCCRCWCAGSSRLSGGTTTCFHRCNYPYRQPTFSICALPQPLPYRYHCSYHYQCLLPYQLPLPLPLPLSLTISVTSSLLTPLSLQRQSPKPLPPP